jgi:uncharacterized protein YbjT (DUF2867 family)
MKKAILFGASGAIGQHLLELLLVSDNYYEIVIVVRNPIKIKQSNRYQQIILPLFKPDDFLTLDVSARNADIFCCLGTTIKKAGSRSAFDKIDRTLVVSIARWAKSQHVASMHVISSLGASINSNNFYLSTKAKMEAELIALDLNALAIYRPSLLYGASRDDFRLGEMLGLLLLYPLILLPFKFCQKIAPIDVEKVAAAMLNGAINLDSKISYYGAEMMRRN